MSSRLTTASVPAELPAPPATAWYRLDAAKVQSTLDTTLAGLTDEEAGQRLTRFGYNELQQRRRSVLTRFLLQFHNPMIYVLLAAATVTAFILQEWPDTSVILGVVILNVIIGFVQEGKAEAAIDALKKMMVLEATVTRAGRKRILPARELVPGDVVQLEGGNRVPADLRLVRVRNLYADESALTGESVPVAKDIEPIDQPHLSPGDQRCMAFSGTFATRGTGLGVVVGTGGQTEFGKIAAMMQEAPAITTPLTRKINEFTRFLIITILIISAVNFATGILFNFPPGYSFLASVALAVAAIPEMLPAVVVAILALASTAMARRHALIRKLPAAETLGCATVICSDKTGTLTRNEMTATNLFCGGCRYQVTGAGYAAEGEFLVDGHPLPPHALPSELLEALRAGARCSHAVIEQHQERHHIVGDPTEGALVVAAAKAGLREHPPMLDEIPFESDTRYMATLHQEDDGRFIYVKGSPETVLALCQWETSANGEQPLRKKACLDEAERMAHGALRVLGLARKRVPLTQTSLTPADLHHLTFLGLIGMIDPPRTEVIHAIQQCKTAGIRVVMITGDHAATAAAIARQIGITSHHANGVLTGEQLEEMSDEQLFEAVGLISVYARSAPEHKLRIARQLQRRGEVVAMTGDGVNDAPALKAADIGIAMGLTGTEVSKEASDMVLADDNFSSIVAAVEEGRHAWKNFQKAVLYTLPTNGGQALLIMGAVLLAPLVALFSIRLPLEPIQILWVNLADSVLLTLPLMMEPKEKGLLNNPPRDSKERIANPLFFLRVGYVSALMALSGFGTYYCFGNPALASETVDALLLTRAQTAAFLAIQWLHIGYLLTARSVHRSAFSFSPFSNPWILLGITVTILTQLLIVYVPALQTLFKTAAVPIAWWPLILLSLLPGFLVTEIEKFIRLAREGVGPQAGAASNCARR